MDSDKTTIEMPSGETAVSEVLVGGADAVSPERRATSPDQSDSSTDHEARRQRRYARARGTAYDIASNHPDIVSYDDGFIEHLEQLAAHSNTLRWALKKLAKHKTSERDSDKKIIRAARKPAMPQLEQMTWNRWCETREESPARSQPAAVDVLCEEIKIEDKQQRKHRRSDQGANATEALACSGAGESTHSLPARIRVNSVAAKRILDGLFEDKLVFSSARDPLIIDRPFKILVWKDDSIRAKLQELEHLHAMREEACRIDPDNRDQAQLQSRSFPSGMIFFTGTDWDSLTTDETKEAVDDFRCLVDFMDKYLVPFRDWISALPSEIPFHGLWHLFSSDHYVFVKNKPQKIWRVIQASGGRRYLSEPEEEHRGWRDKSSPFVVDCYHLDFDGVHVVQVYAKLTLESNDGYIRVASLPFMPLKYAQEERIVDVDGVRERGVAFLNYKKPSHRAYEGLTLSQTPSGKELFTNASRDTTERRVFSERVDSQVVVDMERGIRANPSWSPQGSVLELHKTNDAEIRDEVEKVDRDSHWDTRFSEMLIDKERSKWQSWDRDEIQPTQDDLLLFPDRVFGYVLRNRTWACLQIGTTGHYTGRLRDIVRKDRPWEDLEIPPDHKRIVESLIKNHFSIGKSSQAHQFDLVPDKGKGVIILLHGVPGVGKTATAECVAQSEHRPLLPITCGDLGMKPREVEATLQTSFQLAQAWNCVMLLDEADVFLAQRDIGDVERNALVSVFLRVLEYYEGILFLTTNRVGTFDEAFKSRIHMALYYPPLDLNQTRKIWRNHVRRAREPPMNVTCDEDKLIEYAESLFDKQKDNALSIGPIWNGRQIRNAFQSALALARNKAAPHPDDSLVVEISDFEKVAAVSNDFNNYIWRVNRFQSDADVAKEGGLREDAFKSSTRTKRGSVYHGDNSHIFQQMPIEQNPHVSAGPYPGMNGSQPHVMNSSQSLAMNSSQVPPVYRSGFPHGPMPGTQTGLPQYGMFNMYGPGQPQAQTQPQFSGNPQQPS